MPPLAADPLSAGTEPQPVAELQALVSHVRRILIVSDAWHPQVNGVVRTLEHLADHLTAAGAKVEILAPAGYRTIPMPTYPDIPLALASPGEVAQRIEAFAPDHIHIATEGPLGFWARRYCRRHGTVFTTSYHTRFPEYLRARAPVPEAWSYAVMRRFHNAGSGTLVATPSLARELAGRGFTKVRQWSRGVDTQLFSPDRRISLDLPGPIFLYVGRVAVEKNLPAFLDLDLPGSKVVVGDGPAFATIKEAYRNVTFLGEMSGKFLAEIYASSDVFVFPSLTDTFGIVQLEALASGLPVAAYNVTGPADVFADGVGGALSDDLGEAALKALTLDRDATRRKALGYSWAACAALFMRHLHAAHQSPQPAETAA
ncbi:glycosyltransferase family 1 protein [Pseudaminobacter sp. 19-2017]|uniref:Glycosyltransferase family 1 protein n=1 Tax=Pseudaminobacter soli (ex Zhang et al. 2022) TaxID=2831468 RepID=A0A942DZ62_9HYPH|nr:glycosyltransferase family 1 protein [Pseudaminobacter soli]MBS3650904.1 glycosyltransferase family 1 protein [Pseudaminobacter soli]